MPEDTPRRVPVYFPRRRFLRGAAMIAGGAVTGLAGPLAAITAASDEIEGLPAEVGQLISTDEIGPDDVDSTANLDDH